jgi:hypothetical protein
MTDVKSLATFQVSIGGVPFVGRRRHTALMLQIGNPDAVFGLLANARGGTSKDPEGDLKKYAEATAEMESKALELALVSVGGKTLEEIGMTHEDLAHVGNAFMMAFIRSGLDADPMPES